MPEIKRVTNKEAFEILRLFEEGKGEACKGLFIARSGNIWTAIDNSTGDCWTEDFTSYKKAIDYLKNA